MEGLYDNVEGLAGTELQPDMPGTVSERRRRRVRGGLCGGVGMALRPDTPGTMRVLTSRSLTSRSLIDTKRGSAAVGAHPSAHVNSGGGTMCRPKRQFVRCVWALITRPEALSPLWYPGCWRSPGDCRGACVCENKSEGE